MPENGWIAKTVSAKVNLEIGQVGQKDIQEKKAG
jgi:hypothetical protein